MRPFMSLVLAVSFVVGTAACDDKNAAQVAASAAVPAKCEHGVQKEICARCKPKLEAVFRAKSDWCAEHTRPESQCVLCNPELLEAGVK